jgi:hypothetical protein
MQHLFLLLLIYSLRKPPVTLTLLLSSSTPTNSSISHLNSPLLFCQAEQQFLAGRRQAYVISVTLAHSAAHTRPWHWHWTPHGEFLFPGRDTHR